MQSAKGTHVRNASHVQRVSGLDSLGRQLLECYRCKRRLPIHCFRPATWRWWHQGVLPVSKTRHCRKCALEREVRYFPHRRKQAAKWNRENRERHQELDREYQKLKRYGRSLRLEKRDDTVETVLRNVRQD